jgi:hypothetical protein
MSAVRSDESRQRPRASSSHRALLLAVALLSTVTASFGAATFFAPGDVVRVTKGEMLLFQGKNFLPAPKGQEFTVLQYQPMQNVAYVAFFKEDGSAIAVTLPAGSLEAAPPNGWTDLLRGVQAFRELRVDEARRFLLRAGQDPAYRALATSLSSRLTGYVAASGQQASAAGRQALGTVLLGLRLTAAELAKSGSLTVALALDEGTDRAVAQAYGSATPDPAYGSKLDRPAIAQQVATSQRCVARARQAISLKRLVEARKYVDEGLTAEPERPELKEFAARLNKELKEADEGFLAADRMRGFANGIPHALTALERGLKVCADHPKLLALKKEMSGVFEERTAPPVTPALLTAARAKGPMNALQEGRTLYTTRCAECHELELLDSRSVSGWEQAVSSMSGRAKLSAPEKARILDYLTVAWNSLDSK